MEKFSLPQGYHCDEENVRRLLTSDLSLDYCEGDQNSENIEFTSDVIYEPGILDLIRNPGNFVQSAPINLYHSHVLWSYKHQTTRQKDGTFKLSLVSAGPHVDIEGNVDEDHGPENKLQPPPEILASTITFVRADDPVKATYQYEPDGNGVWVCVKHFTREELASFAFDDPDYEVILFRLRIIIARAYFDLLKLLKEPTTVSERTASTVECILRGEKPAGCDYSFQVDPISGDDSRPLSYHVHSTEFHRMSKGFLDGNSGLAYKGCYLEKLTPEDVPAIISLYYGTPVPLPTNTHAMKKLVIWAGAIFNEDTGKRLLAGWERAICREAVALDKTDLRSFTRLARLYTYWMCVLGRDNVLMASAKAATVGVLAEMALLHKTAGARFDQARLDHDSVIGRAFAEVGFSLKDTNIIMEAMFESVAAFRMVTKVGLATKKGAKSGAEVPPLSSPAASPPRDFSTPTVASSPVSPPRDFSTPTVVVIDDDDDDAVDVVGNTDPNEASAVKEQTSQWQCAIS